MIYGSSAKERMLLNAIPPYHCIYNYEDPENI